MTALDAGDGGAESVATQTQSESPQGYLGLAARDLVRTFTVKGVCALVLDNINLGVPQGEFVSVIGPSGCGKSTLLRIFADLLPTTSGTAEVDGMTPQAARLDRRLGVVFQAPNLMPWRSVLRNVELPLEVAGQGRHDRERFAREMIQLVGLEGYERHAPRQLSGGMQQRVAIARALTTKPNVLLMDEPFGALDEITRDRLNLELMSIWERLHPTVLFITHSIAEAVFLSTRVVVMAARPGRVIDEFVIDFPHPRTAQTRNAPQFHEYLTRIRQALMTGGDR
jgi:NitT/TauT family transport system ATP-binding protein